jgi:uncharacterized protein
MRPGDTPHFPQPAAIEAYGKGGFAFAGMSHRGAILCLPDGIWAWENAPGNDTGANRWPLDAAMLAPFFAHAALLDVVLLGSGTDLWIVPPDVRSAFREQGIVVEAMQTGPAVRMFNIMLGERRRVGAGFLPVE